MQEQHLLQSPGWNRNDFRTSCKCARIDSRLLDHKRMVHRVSFSSSWRIPHDVVFGLRANSRVKGRDSRPCPPPAQSCFFFSNCVARLLYVCTVIEQITGKNKVLFVRGKRRDCCMSRTLCFRLEVRRRLGSRISSVVVASQLLQDFPWPFARSGKLL